jgi:hypothetical protein
MTGFFFFFLHTNSIPVPNEGDYEGKISSTVLLSERPDINGVANFGDEGAPYTFVEDGVAILWNGAWALFISEQDLLLNEKILRQ